MNQEASPAQSDDGVSDAINALRAIAHPVRMRLYETLVLSGPATNARLAKEVPGAPGSLSYHLWQLAKQGFIEEAPDLGQDGRERWWRATPGKRRWADIPATTNVGYRQANHHAESVRLQRQLDHIRTWMNEGHTQWHANWQEAAFTYDTSIVLTPPMLAEFADDIAALVDKYTQRSTDVAEEPDAERVHFALHAFPIKTKDAPE